MARPLTDEEFDALLSGQEASVDPLLSLIPPGAAAPSSTPTPDPTPPKVAAQAPTAPTLAPAEVAPAAFSMPSLDALYGPGLGDKDLQGAQSSRDSQQLIANLGGIGSGLVDNLLSARGIQGVKPNQQFFDKLIDQSTQGISDITTRRKGKDEELKFKKETISLATEQEKADPNSAVSKMTVGIINDMAPGLGVKGLSASQIEKLLGPISTWSARKLVMEERKESRIDRETSKKEVGDEKKQLKIDDYTSNAAKELRTSTAWKELTTTANQADAIKSRINSASGYDDMATIFQMMKGLDPSSVVRESEYKNAAELGNLWNKFQNAIEKRTAGEFLQPAQRKQIAELMDAILEGHKKRFERHAASAYRSVEKRGGDTTFLPSIKDIESSGQPSKSEGKIKVSNGKKSFMIDEKDLKSAEKDGYKQVQ